MTSNTKIRLLIIVAVTLVCIYGLIRDPDTMGIPTSKQELVEHWRKNIRLGTDLKGGSNLVYQIEMQDAFKLEADTIIQRLRDELAKASIPFADITRNDPDFDHANSIQINIAGVPGTKAGDFRTIANDNFGSVWILTPVNETDYRMTMKASEALRVRSDTLSQTINTVEKKINGLGLAESSVQQRGESQILVTLPGVDDPARIKQILQTAAILELYEVQGGPFASREEAMQSKNGILPLSSQILGSGARAGTPNEFYILARTPVVTGRDLRDAKPTQNGQTGGWETNFVLTQDAAKRFEKFTGSHINDRLAIVLDKKVLSAPTIQAKISDNGVITNMGGHDAAADLALNLKAGSLPASLLNMEERSVGPSLGADSIRQGIVSGIAGVVAVVALMLIYYKRSGINATLALILNALILVAALSYFEAVLTLPGIAGIILTIGMAVDSNVLIFERIREELRAGKAVVAAVEAGFGKAFLTIIDTHVTTIVSCCFLFLFGTGPVKGFAVTLVIGLFANVFTAVFVSRTIFNWELGGQKRAVTLSI
ncbi:MAG: protein translocase subunit SecD [Acidobacteriia bacterium]|nr:protein translocase subunit SecD [Terriglobia bacterium]